MDNRGGGYQEFASENVSLTELKKFAGGNPLVFHSILVSKNLGIKYRGWGASRFSVRNIFVSQCIESTSYGNPFLQSFRNFPKVEKY